MEGVSALSGLFQEKKSRFVFESCNERKLFPISMAPDRLGNELLPLRGAPNRGPGCYDNEEMTCMHHNVKKFICSKRGYSCLARTGPRFHAPFMEETPCPTHYQTKWTDLRTFKTESKPFQVGADRFPVYRRDFNVAPGPGAYAHDVDRCRKVQWHQTFGGAPRDLPSVPQQSSIAKNTDKLLSTKEQKKMQRKHAYLKLYFD